MESLGLRIDFNIFKKHMEYLRWLDHQQRAIEKLLDCDIYGGPMTAWEHEMEIWNTMLSCERARGWFGAFACYYAYGELTTSCEYCYRNDFDDYCEETVYINDAITDENWLKMAWDKLMELEQNEG